MTTRASARRIVLRRALLAPVILLAVTFTVFVMVDLSPRDPATAVLGQFTSLEARERFAQEHGLNDPLLVRFGRFLGELVRFNLGDSVTRPDSVSHLIGQALPVSLQLMAFSILLIVLLSVPLGVLAAWQEGRLLDRAISGIAAVFQATPEFWLGLMFIQLVALQWGLVPAGGYSPISHGVTAWFTSIIGPAVVLALGITAGLTRVVRASMADELAKDYVITARGGGLSWPVVLFRNVLRNALITPVTVLGMIIGSLITGTVLVETVFDIPGMGSLLIWAVNAGDLAVVRGVTIVAAAVFVLANLIVDLLYLALSSGSAEATAQ